jgi:hypothetical protein
LYYHLFYADVLGAPKRYMSQVMVGPVFYGLFLPLSHKFGLTRSFTSW